MAKAFVLINCDLGAEDQVISELKSLDCDKDVYRTFGYYDILANLQCDNLEDLRQLIISEVRRIKKIRSTITLMGITNKC